VAFGVFDFVIADRDHTLEAPLGDHGL